MAATGGDRPSTFALVGATGKGNLRRRRDGDVQAYSLPLNLFPYGAKKRPRLGRCWSSLPSSLRLCRLRGASAINCCYPALISF